METQNNIPDLPKLSVYRYENFLNIYNDKKSDMKFYNLLRNINVFSSENSAIEDSYTIQYKDSWAYISHKIYGTIELWWLICAYNQIENPLNVLEAGSKIKILKPEYVYPVLSEIKTQINL